MVSSLLLTLGFDESEEPLCVRFVNTVGERSGPGYEEYLATPEDLRRWMEARGLLPGGVELSGSYRERALELRDGIYGLLSSLAGGRVPAEPDLEALNAELAEALAKIELNDSLAWSLTETDARERALMLLSLSAAGLLTSHLAPRIRECANATCGWIFVDHSKNRSRRWCSMSDCGNKEKARRFQSRRRAKT